MKRLFYALLFVLASVATMTSCTEEDVAPIEQTNNGGGAGSLDPMIP